MDLQIFSMQATHFYTVAWLEINTPNGNFIIQSGHAPMIINLTPYQPITFRLSNGKQETVIPRSGIAQINREKTVLLISESD